MTDASPLARLGLPDDPDIRSIEIKVAVTDRLQTTLEALGLDVRRNEKTALLIKTPTDWGPRYFEVRTKELM